MTLDFALVFIVDVANGIATVRDNLGKTMSLRTDIRRVGALLPQAGERWVIDRSLGDWTFAALITSDDLTPVSDHGALTGLGDDDHPQYHNDARAEIWHDADDHDALTITESQITDLQAYALVTDLDDYLTLVDAAATYLTQSSAASTYLTQANAATTYLPLAGGTLSGDLRINGGSGALSIGSDGVSDLAYMGFYARDAAPSTRSGWIGYGSSAATELHIYNELNDDIILRTAAGIVLFWDQSDLSIRIPSTVATRLRIPDGTVSEPGLMFDSDTDTGVYRVGANQVGLTAAGVDQLVTGNSGNPGIRIPDGSVSVPGLVFNGDTDTGLRRVTTNTMAMVAAGADVFRMVSTAGTIYSGTDASWSGFTALERWAAQDAGIFHACRSAGESMFLGRNTSNGSVVRFDRSGTQVGSISVTTTATAYNVSSDERLKGNIRDASFGGLETVRQWKVREWEWLLDDSPGIGFVAQEMLSTVPHVINERDSGYLEMDYGKVTPELTLAIQELDIIMQGFDKRLKALEA